jgi:hypothetical protein
MRRRTITSAVIAGAVAVLAVQLTAQGGKPASKGDEKPAKNVSADERLEALSRAQVWRAPTVPVSQTRMGSDPAQPDYIECKFKMTELGGTSPKFDCVMDNGDQIRVKYGSTPEIPSEVAATRLLHALGFAADDVMLVARLRCHGCPAKPFIAMKAVDLSQTAALYEKLIDYGSHKDFDWVAVERKHPGRAIGTDQTKGWAFFELEVVDAKKGGAPRAHVDALRLMALFLAHWDNKSENQRLVCLSDEDWPEGGRCQRPFAMLQDMGSAFGPKKVDLKAWEQAPIWENRRTCAASMETLPLRGATFAPVTITEAGRRHLASLLGQLTDQQLADLFTGARFDKMKAFVPSRQDTVADWVRVFNLKVREISDGPACPQ